MKQMKKFIPFLFAGALLSALVGCQEEHKTYSGPEYVMFADTMSVNMIHPDDESFAVPVASTVACDYDRTFGVEIVDLGSNAIEGKHYRLLSNTITIKAGERSANVLVHGIYDNIEPTDSLGFILSLVMPEQLDWELYDNRQTKVTMLKSCPLDINDFTGYCVVTSLLLYNYPAIDNSDYQRLIRTELHPTEPNAILLHDAFYDGYDVTLRFSTEDRDEQNITVDSDTVLSDEQSVFGQTNGDNRILGESSAQHISYFSSCQRFAALWLRVYVKDLDTTVGTVGYFYNVFEWISDEEAERLKREEGIYCPK